MDNKTFNETYDIMEVLNGEDRRYILINKETLHIDKKVMQVIKLNGDYLTFKGRVHVSVGR